MKRVKVVEISPDKCTGCRLCEAVCSAGHAAERYRDINPKTSRIRVFCDQENDVYYPVIAGAYTDVECVGRNTVVVKGKETVEKPEPPERPLTEEQLKAAAVVKADAENVLKRAEQNFVRKRWEKVLEGCKQLKELGQQLINIGDRREGEKFLKRAKELQQFMKRAKELLRAHEERRIERAGRN